MRNYHQFHDLLEIMETIIYTDVTPRQKAKVARILLGKRQVDIAAEASVTVLDVSRLEKMISLNLSKRGAS